MVDQFWLHFNGTGGPGPYISKKKMVDHSIMLYYQASHTRGGVQVVISLDKQYCQIFAK